MVFPVAGFLPSLAALLETEKVPNPTNAALSPDFKDCSIPSNTAFTASAAWAFVIPAALATELVKSPLFMSTFFKVNKSISEANIYNKNPHTTKIHFFFFNKPPIYRLLAKIHTKTVGKDVLLLSINVKKMKKLLLFIALLLSVSTLGTLSSCSPKVGCEINEAQSPKVDRKGRMSTKGGKSQLFGKKQRKRMGM